MCFALPARVEELRPDGTARVESASGPREVSVLLIPEVTVGEYVLINLGVAVQRMPEEDARELMVLWQEMANVFGGNDEQPMGE